MAISFLSNALGSEDLVDKISRTLHKSYIDDCAPHLIKGSLTPLEKAFRAVDPRQELVTRYKAVIKTDLDWCDWTQVAIHFPDTNRYIIFHGYSDGMEDETILVDGFVEGSALKVERLYYSYQNDEPCLTMKEVITRYREIYNLIPFQHFADVFEEEALVNIDYSYVSGKTWHNLDYVLAWFRRYRRFKRSDYVS